MYQNCPSSKFGAILTVLLYCCCGCSAVVHPVASFTGCCLLGVLGVLGVLGLTAAALLCVGIC